MEDDPSQNSVRRVTDLHCRSWSLTSVSGSLIHHHAWGNFAVWLHCGFAGTRICYGSWRLYAEVHTEHQHDTMKE